MTDQQALWDARYAAADYLFGTEPNAYLASQEIGRASCRERVSSPV